MGGSKVLKRMWEEVKKNPKRWFLSFLIFEISFVVATWVIDLMFREQFLLLHDVLTLIFTGVIVSVVNLGVYVAMDKHKQ